MIENDKPTVFGTAWEAADGTRALVFANATDKAQDIAYRWEGKWMRMTLPPHGLELMPK